MLNNSSKTELILKKFVLGPFQVNTYLLFDPSSKKLLIIDPAMGSDEVSEQIREWEPIETVIFLTHGHADHIMGVDELANETGAKVYCSREDAPMLTDASLNLSLYFGAPFTVATQYKPLKHGDSIILGENEGKILSVPGHTKGSLVLNFENMLFTGDTLFAGSIGRSDFPGGDGDLLIKMIEERIFSLPDKKVLPGHGPESTISIEKTSNPFFF